MIKTKLFDNRGEQMIDTLINDFLEKGNRKLIDIKLTSVEENQFTQCEYIAVLIYEEGDTDKETIKVLGDATKELMNQNKRYREELDILGEVINSATNADKLNEEYERLKGLEGEE